MDDFVFPDGIIFTNKTFPVVELGGLELGK